MCDFLVSLLSSLVVPPYCGNCHRYLIKRESLCDTCKEQIVPVPSSKIGTLTIHAVSAFEYPLKSLINNSYESSVYVGKLLAETLSVEADYLIPVPRFNDHLKKGYSASGVLAEQVGQLRGIPILECIARVRPPLRRGVYTKVERLRYLYDAFRVTPDISEISGKRVVLIDDVCISGITLAVVAEKIGLGGPKQVQGLVVCRSSVS